MCVYFFPIAGFFEVPEAKRMRFHQEQQQQQQKMAEQQLQRSRQQQQQQQQHHMMMQMQAAAALRHHYSATYNSYSRASRSTAAAQQAQRERAAAAAQQIQPARPAQRPMISSFQQITPPESLAFWQQQQNQLMQQLTSCRSPCCAGSQPAMCCPNGPTLPPRYCYVMPPTPLISQGQPAQPFCIGCAQGKCQVNLNKENLGIMRSL